MDDENSFCHKLSGWTRDTARVCSCGRGHLGSHQSARRLHWNSTFQYEVIGLKNPYSVSDRLCP